VLRVPGSGLGFRVQGSGLRIKNALQLLINRYG